MQAYINNTRLSRWQIVAVAILSSMVVTSCSSTKVNSDGEDVVSEEVVDAGTDAVPEAAAEPIASTDPAADPNAGLAAEATPETPPVDSAAQGLEELSSTSDPAAAPVNTEQPLAESTFAETSAETTTEPVAETQSSFGGGPTEQYSVRSGDTLMRIAFETYGDIYQWRKIYEANRDVIQDPNSIPPGTALKLEKPSQQVSISRNGDPYTIKNGDTLGTISNQVYGTTSKWRDIWENNRELIKDPNKIYAGFTLYYAPSSSMVQEPRAPASTQ